MKQYGVYNENGSPVFVGSWKDCANTAKLTGGTVRPYRSEEIVEADNDIVNSAEKDEGIELLMAYEGRLIETTLAHTDDVFDLPDGPDLDVMFDIRATRAARSSLVKYVEGLEAKVAAMQINSNPGVVGKRYVAINMSDPNDGGRVFAMWDLCKEYVDGKSHMAYRKVASEAEATTWLITKVAERDQETELPDEYAVDCSADSTWPLEKNGLPVDGGEDDRSLDGPPWSSDSQKPIDDDAPPWIVEQDRPF